MIRFAFAALALSLAASPALALAADGATLFNMQCKMCHGGSPMGPSLAGVAGGKIAAKADFAYSPGLKNHGGTWTDENLDAFLASPAAFAPGSKMMISVGSEESRKAIIEYLKTLK